MTTHFTTATTRTIYDVMIFVYHIIVYWEYWITQFIYDRGVKPLDLFCTAIERKKTRKRRLKLAQRQLFNSKYHYIILVKNFKSKLTEV